MNEFEVTNRIRQNNRLPFIPILLITGYDQIHPAEGFELGAEDFIRKPVDFNILLVAFGSREACPRSRHSARRPQ